MGQASRLKNIFLIAALACALGLIFVAATSREITKGIETTLIYLFLGTLAFGVAGIIAKFVASQRE